jgi:formiminotetrahydrofolate cyclodeaminase
MKLWKNIRTVIELTNQREKKNNNFIRDSRACSLARKIQSKICNVQINLHSN